MLILRRRSFIVFLSIAGLVGACAQALAQDLPGPAELPAAARQIRTGDAAGALFTLSRAAADAVGQPAILARVHAYQAWAYLELNQPERAQNAARLALETDAAIVLDAGEFTPPVIAFVEDVRHPSLNPEAAGDAADRAGQLPAAFIAYLNAFRSLPEPAAPGDDQRLRAKIISIAVRLPAKPIVPPDAVDHQKKASDLLEAEAVLGASAVTEQTAAAELHAAVRIAPWWPEATFQLATVLQKLQRVDEALVNLNLFKLASPSGTPAIAERAPARNVPAATLAAAPTAIPEAVIYVYFPHAIRGGGAKLHLLCDGQPVADLANGRFVRLNASPGQHEFDLKGAHDLFNHKNASTFVSGQEHYIRAGIEGVPAHFALQVTESGKAVAEMREKKLEPNDAAHTFSSDCRGAVAVEKPKKR